MQNNVRWATGFGLLAMAMAMTFAIFLLGSKRYWTQRPLGSPLTSAAKVIVAAARKWHLNEAHHGLSVY